MKKLIILTLVLFGILCGSASAVSLSEGSRFTIDEASALYENDRNEWNGKNYSYKTADSFKKGSGTKYDPYMISTWEEFNLMGEIGCGDGGKGLYFKLENAMDFNSFTEISDEHQGSQVVQNRILGSEEKPFEANFDGGDFLLYVTCERIFDVIGENGSVGNFKSYKTITRINHGSIENCKIKCDTVGYPYGIGSRYGFISGINTGVIRRCSAVSPAREIDDVWNINGYEESIGGICGYNNGGTIEECYARLSITSNENKAKALGGIAGESTNGIIKNCRSDFFIKNSGSETGGIVGRLNGGIVENCIAVGAIEGSLDYAGTIAGKADNGGEIISSYALEHTLPSNRSIKEVTVGNATPETAYYGDGVGALYAPSTYKDWSREIWAFNYADYPALKWMYSFPDVNEHWARDIVQFMAEKGNISGYEDGSFRPDDIVTKAELIVMVASVYNVNTNNRSRYLDVPDWAQPYVALIEKFMGEDITNMAVSDTVFGAEKPITRAEAVSVAGSMFYASGNVDVDKFTDVDQIPEWTKKYIAKSTVSGYEDGSFQPDNTLTRAEAAALLWQIYMKYGY